MGDGVGYSMPIKSIYSLIPMKLMCFLMALNAIHDIVVHFPDAVSRVPYSTVDDAALSCHAVGGYLLSL